MALDIAAAREPRRFAMPMTSDPVARAAWRGGFRVRLRERLGGFPRECAPIAMTAAPATSHAGYQRTYIAFEGLAGVMVPTWLLVRKPVTIPAWQRTVQACWRAAALKRWATQQRIANLHLACLRRHIRQTTRADPRTVCYASIVKGITIQSFIHSGEETMVQAQHRLGFVLIHGGGLESWVWERLIPYLHLPALAVHRLPPHTSRNQLTLTDCARYIHAQVEQAGFEHTILVAHSIAGVLAPAVALLAPQRVAHMVFVGANIPAEGMTALSAFRGIERWQVAVGTLLSAWNLTPQKGLEQYIRQRLCHDLDEATTEQVVQGGKHPEPRALFFERISRRSLPAIPSTYIKLLQDRALPPAIQERMVATIGAQMMTLDCGHTAMLSRPAELAAILNTIADSASATARQYGTSASGGRTA